MGSNKENKTRTRTIERVAVIGAGVMGHGIAQVFAQHGCTVKLCDIAENSLRNALEKIRSNLRLCVEMGIEREAVSEAVISRITATTDLQDALRGMQFVTEAVPEDLDLKKELFKEIDAVTDENVIMASNTSTLSITELTKSIKNSGRFLITHWFNPPHLVPVVEVVKATSTTEETFRRTFQFLEDMGKDPVHVLKPVPGFLVNRIQTAMFREVVALLEDGVATPEDIDKTVRGSLGLRLAAMGPLTVVDFAGVHLWHTGAQNLYPLLDASKEPRKLWTEMVEKGFLGQRTGKGFFEYQAGSIPDRIRNRDAKLIEILKVLCPRQHEGSKHDDHD
jgi:3-hydroxybutyryl-CoA dehydrogenase